MQGESTKASENKALGKFSIRNIPAGAAGEQKYVVKFELDEDHTLKVTATNKSTGAEQVIAQKTLAMSKEKVQEMAAANIRLKSRISFGENNPELANSAFSE